MLAPGLKFILREGALRRRERPELGTQFPAQLRYTHTAGLRWFGSTAGQTLRNSLEAVKDSSLSLAGLAEAVST